MRLLISKISTDEVAYPRSYIEVGDLESKVGTVPQDCMHGTKERMFPVSLQPACFILVCLFAPLILFLI